MSQRIMLTLPDELAALVDARRGPLDRQTFIMAALASVCDGQTLAQRVAELERRLAAIEVRPAAPQSEEMLSF